MEDESSTVKSSEIWVTKFDEEHAQKFRQALLDATRSDPSKPVVIYIDSYGGYADALAKMIETMDEVANPLITVCMGKAMSCGAILLSHGDVRFLGKHSRIMVHEVSSGTGGNIHDMKEDVKETARLNEYFIGLLARNCGFKNYEELRSVIKEQDGRERYLVGQEAIDFGIVDAIGLPKIYIQALYEVGKQPTRTPMSDRNKQSIISGRKMKSKKKPAATTKKSDTNKRR